MSVADIAALAGTVVTVALAGLAYAYKSGHTDAKLESMKDAISDVKAELLRSATSQGERLGELKDLVGTLFDFKNRTEAVQQERNRRDTQGIVAHTNED